VVPGGARWSFLGQPALGPGAPADLVAYDLDPRTDLAVLYTPARVIHRGRVIR
jgi:imidazolonepropionase-like amidohydrolase